MGAPSRIRKQQHLRQQPCLVSHLPNFAALFHPISLDSFTLSLSSCDILSTNRFSSPIQPPSYLHIRRIDASSTHSSLPAAIANLARFNSPSRSIFIVARRSCRLFSQPVTERAGLPRDGLFPGREEGQLDAKSFRLLRSHPCRRRRRNGRAEQESAGRRWCIPRSTAGSGC
jgi:hypothetical protein